MTSLTQALAKRLTSDWGDVFDRSQHVCLAEIVRNAWVDTAACILAGRSDPATAIALRWARDQSAPGGTSASVLWGEERLPPALAALVNGVAGHALDYDDVGLAGHPSVVLVPALLAEHERSGLCGRDLLQAYAKGYAVWGELQRRLKTGLHARGWHPTSIFGTVAVTAALASARRLEAHHVAHALGISASMAAGVVANFGSMTKPLQVGRATQAGFTAVDLAQAGLESSPDALDGPAGLLAALVGPSQVDRTSAVPEGFETTLLRQPPGIKQYPVCYAAHRVVDGIIDLAGAHDIAPQDVVAIDATLSATTAGVLRHHAPGTLAQARFSLEFAAATALVYRRLGMREVAEPTLLDPRVQALMPRVRTHTTDTSCPLEPSFAYEDEVVLTLRNGQRLSSGPIRFARGHAERPLASAQVEDKLFGCLMPGEAPWGHTLLSRLTQMLQAVTAASPLPANPTQR